MIIQKVAEKVNDHVEYKVSLVFNNNTRRVIIIINVYKVQAGQHIGSWVFTIKELNRSMF